MESEFHFFLYAVVIACLLLVVISSAIPHVEVSATRVLQAILITILAGIGFSIYLFGVIAVLKIAGYFAGLLVSMLAIGFSVSMVLGRRSERTYQIRQARVLERFPSATKLEINRICASLDCGKTLDDFKWDGERVILGEGDNAKIAGIRGWVPINAAAPEYVYLEQQKEIDFRLHKLGVKLSTGDHHDFCALLYFNWEILELRVGGESHALLAILGRRADTRYERYPLFVAENTG